MNNLSDALKMDLELVLSYEGDRDEIKAFHTLKEAARRYANLLEMVAEQAEDEGLWFVGVTAPEEYLMAALRRLHVAIEGTTEPTNDLAR